MNILRKSFSPRVLLLLVLLVVEVLSLVLLVVDALSLALLVAVVES